MNDDDIKRLREAYAEEQEATYDVCHHETEDTDPRDLAIERAMRVHDER